MIPPTLKEVEAEFDIFWEAYPMKKGKAKAEEHWLKHKPVLAEVMAALELQKREKSWLRQKKRFVPEWPYGSTWVNQQRWRDGYDPEFERYLKYEKEKPLRKEKENQLYRQRIRNDYGEYLESKSDKALIDLRSERGYLSETYNWLIDEILQKRKAGAYRTESESKGES